MVRNRIHRLRSGPKRMTSWLDIPPTATTLTGGGGTLTHTLSAAELAKLPFTIVRTYVEFFIQFDQTAASELQFVAFGGLVVSQQAVAVGVSAMPTPFNELGSDFFFVHKVMLSNFVFGTGVGFEEPSGLQYSIDSKAMRKVNEDEDIALVVELSTVGGGAVVQMAGRMLIKEH